MAKKQVVKFVPTVFEMWLACEMLGNFRCESDTTEAYKVIEGFVFNRPVDTRLTMNLRKWWFTRLTLGLNETQYNELVNIKR